MPPSVSVIIPTFNRPKLLVEAVQSVLAQSFQDFEIIVVDDGSEVDAQKDLAEGKLLERVRFVRQANSGLSSARNHGIRLAKADLITFLDDDDLYREDKLEKQVGFFSDKKDAFVLHSWFSKFDVTHQNLGVRKTSWFQGNIYPQILGQWSVLMAAPCVMVRRSVFETVGYFDENLKTAEDLDMWRRLARKYPFHVIEQPLVQIRQQGLSMSSDRTRSSRGFRIMLDKAFADDQELPPQAQKNYLAKMYAQTAQNLLGDGSASDMPQVRSDAAAALRARPLQLSAWAAWLVSFLPRFLRGWLAGGLRRLRFRSI
jgi:glycosyltransferase involved in cell wall biosynthesis